MAILPSDHFIRNRDLFHYLLREAFEVAKQNYLVTLGITPDVPIYCVRIHPAGRGAEQGVQVSCLPWSSASRKSPTRRPHRNSCAPEIIPGTAACSSGERMRS